jgi:hypothetical protein
VHFLRRKFTSAEIMGPDIKRFQSSPTEASETAAKPCARQTKAAQLGVLALLGLGMMPLLLQVPVSSRQSLSLTAQSAAPVETFSPQGQGSDTLAKARQIAQQRGDLEAAIATASQIPSHSLLYLEAQTQILQWQQQKWQAQDAAFQQMQQAYAAKNWQTVLDIATQDVPHTQYWLNHKGVLQMMVKARAELLTAAKSS